MVRAKLDRAELESYPKTTGGDGMHLFVPLEPRYTYEQVRSFAELLAALVAHERPGPVHHPARGRRAGRRARCISIGRRSRRARPSPPRMCCGPMRELRWRRLWLGARSRRDLNPAQFHIGNALARFDRVGDLFEGVLKKPQELEPALEKLSGGL